jgi:hypothetical protein
MLKDDSGAEVAFVPASEFYKKIIRDQLMFSLQFGEEFYNKVRESIAEHLINDKIYKQLEPKFMKEVSIVTRIPFSQMAEIAEKNKKVHQLSLDLNIDTEVSTKPQLKLVK